MRTCRIGIATVLLARVSVGFCASGWHTNLAYPGATGAAGAYWTSRVAVTVENTFSSDLAGASVRVVVGKGEGEADFVGLPAQSVRVVNEAGAELLCDVGTAEGSPRRNGPMIQGDVLTMPAEVPAGGKALLYVYAGNPLAWEPPDYLGGQLSNGGFEVGETEPTGWSTALVDASHRMIWQVGGAHTGNRCVRCEVEDNAEATWVKYWQGRIPVIAGQKYRFSAWVKADNVKGRAGWYVHVDGDKPQMINNVQGAEGTFDWREIVIEFEVPPGGQTFSCGTVLYGSGTAWYDDAKLEMTGGPELKVSVASTERLELRTVQGRQGWEAGEDWLWRTPVIVRNFTDGDSRSALVSIDMHRPRTLLAKHADWRYELPLRIIDPEDPGRPLAYAWADGQVMVSTSVAARSEKILAVYWSPKNALAEASEKVNLAAWSADEMNLAVNGDMEQPEGNTAVGWPSSEEGREEAPARFAVQRVAGGVHGEWCLQLSVPREVEQVGWVGSRQKVRVKPGTTYLLAGYIKAQGLNGDARIHGHFRKEDGSLSDFSPFFGTSPGVSGDSDWTLTTARVTTPSDCAFIEIHLTMNCTGVLMHDAILLTEAQTGEAGALEGRNGGKEEESLAVWSADPMVKIFRDDWPTGEKPDVHVYACRNEYEPFQLALRSRADGSVMVRARELTGPGGAKLPAPKVYEVGYVPVDFPVGYASSDQPYYYRLKPTTRGTDGWSEDWPDPLIPLRDGSVRLVAGRTQPLWFDVRVPAETSPGEYTGTVELSFAGATYTVSVKLTVWPLVLPERKNMKAIYDLRSGWRNIFPGDRWEMIATWLRLLSSYNVSPGVIEPSPKISYEGGKLSMDFAEFDRTCTLLFDELKCNVAYTPGFFYALGWAYPPKEYFGFKPFTPEWIQIFQDGLRMFYNHCREKGWDKYFVYYLSDEPDGQNDEVQSNLARICDLAREAVPGILVYSSTWSHQPKLDDHLNLWGIGPQGTFPLEEMEQRRKAGDRFWFTTDGQMCLDTPYLAIERLLPWLCFKYNVEAYEFWGVSWWTYDPWKYGWHSYIRQSHEGKVYRWVRYPNGDGFLTYPGDALGQKEPVPSIRLAAAREGVEDYELFLAAQAKADQVAACARALDGVRELVQIPNKGGRHSTSLMPNPTAVQGARVALGEALAQADGR